MASLRCFPVYKRELLQYLQTPGTYVALAFFLLLSGAIFLLVMGDFVDASARLQQGQPPGELELPVNLTVRVVTQLFSVLNFLLLFLIPLLTMRLLAEEKHSGSFELLVSTPLENRHILLGKYFAALTISLAVLVLTLVYPLILFAVGKPEMPVVISCYVGLFLIMAAYTALGLFTSALTQSQITAAVLAFVGILIFHMIHFLLKAGLMGKIASALSVYQHSEQFTKGVLRLSDGLYFILFTAFFLFLASQVLDARKWRG